MIGLYSVASFSGLGYVPLAGSIIDQAKLITFLEQSLGMFGVGSYIAIYFSEVSLTKQFFIQETEDKQEVKEELERREKKSKSKQSISNRIIQTKGSSKAHL